MSKALPVTITVYCTVYSLERHIAQPKDNIDWCLLVCIDRIDPLSSPPVITLICALRVKRTYWNMPEVRSRKTWSRSTTQRSPVTWAKAERWAGPLAPRTPRAAAVWRPFPKKPWGRRSSRMRKEFSFRSSPAVPSELCSFCISKPGVPLSVFTQVLSLSTLCHGHSSI